MNAAHIHLLFNHIPIIGSMFCLLLLGAGYLFERPHLVHASLTGIVLVALVSIVAFASGDGAKEIVEKLPGISKDAIEKHEHFADISFWLLEGTGLMALLTLIIGIRNKRLAKAAMGLVFIMLLAVCLMMIRTGNLGGKIHHPEINSSGVTMSGENENDGK